MKKKITTATDQRQKGTLLAEAIVETEETNTTFRFPKKIKEQLQALIKKRKTYAGGTALVIASFIANVLTYVFNAYLGRVLRFEDFALIGLISSFYSLSSIPFSAYGTTVTYKGSFLIGKYGDAAGYSFWQHARKNIKHIPFILAGIWLLSTPLLMQFFHTDVSVLFFSFSIVLLVGFISYINQGFLASKMMFGSLAVISLIDPATKLLVAFLLVFLGLQMWTFSAIPLAAFVVFLTGWLLILKQVPNEKTTAPHKEVKSISKKFFTLSLLTTFSSIAFFTLDIFLAKHFLSATDAGKYALVSLVGKMIFFLGNLTGPFIIPLVSRYEGARKNSVTALYLLLGITSVFAFVGFLLFGIFGFITVPILYGSKAITIVPYLLIFTFGMMCYTISGVIVNYYLVRKMYTFTIATSLLILLQIFLITLFHTDVRALTIDMGIVFIVHLLLTASLHFCTRSVQRFEEQITERVAKAFIK